MEDWSCQFRALGETGRDWERSRLLFLSDQPGLVCTIHSRISNQGPHYPESHYLQAGNRPGSVSMTVSLTRCWTSASAAKQEHLVRMAGRPQEEEVLSAWRPGPGVPGPDPCGPSSTAGSSEGFQHTTRNVQMNKTRIVRK